MGWFEAAVWLLSSTDLLSEGLRGLLQVLLRVVGRGRRAGRALLLLLVVGRPAALVVVHAALRLRGRAAAADRVVTCWCWWPWWWWCVAGCGWDVPCPAPPAALARGLGAVRLAEREDERLAAGEATGCGSLLLLLGREEDGWWWCRGERLRGGGGRRRWRLGPSLLCG